MPSSSGHCLLEGGCGGCGMRFGGSGLHSAKCVLKEFARFPGERGGGKGFEPLLTGFMCVRG
jgi:hypothetical protein